MIFETYDMGNGLCIGVMGGDAIMNAYRQEEKQTRREAIRKAREQNDTDRRTNSGSIDS